MKTQNNQLSDHWVCHGSDERELAKIIERLAACTSVVSDGKTVFFEAVYAELEDSSEPALLTEDKKIIPWSMVDRGPAKNWTPVVKGEAFANEVLVSRNRILMPISENITKTIKVAVKKTSKTEQKSENTEDQTKSDFDEEKNPDNGLIISAAKEVFGQKCFLTRQFEGTSKVFSVLQANTYTPQTQLLEYTKYVFQEAELVSYVVDNFSTNVEYQLPLGQILRVHLSDLWTETISWMIGKKENGEFVPKHYVQIKSSRQKITDNLLIPRLFSLKVQSKHLTASKQFYGVSGLSFDPGKSRM